MQPLLIISTRARWLACLAAISVLSGAGYLPAAQAAPVSNAAPVKAGKVLTARSGAAFLPSHTGNPINERDRVAGSTRVGGQTRAAVFNLRTRSMKVLSAFPGLATLASDINASGEVSGQVQRADGTQKAFIWSTRTGAIKTLTAPGAIESWANAINDRGVVVGGVRTDSETHAEVWKTRSGSRFALEMDDAVGVNASGWVIGRKLRTDPSTSNLALLYTPGSSTLKVLPPLADDDGAEANDINDAGFAVGQSYSLERDDFVLRPVLWKAAGALPCRLSPAEGNNFATAINEHNQVVGVEVSFVDGTHRSVLWKGCAKPGLTLPWDPDSSATPTGINDRGRIVGYSGDRGVAWRLPR